MRLKQKRAIGPLDFLFVAFFASALLAGVVRCVFQGDLTIFNTILQATFQSAQTAFEIALALTGVLCFWMGLMSVGEKSGLIPRMAKGISPLLRTLFPSIPQGDPAMGKIFMSISANLLGLDNAATPLGLETMKRLQELNKEPDRASDAMIMFLAINASGLTLIPTSIMAFRMQAGASNPADIFFPILLATLVSTIVAILLVGAHQRIKLWQAPLLLFFGGIALLIALIILLKQQLSPEMFGTCTTLAASLLLLTTIVLFLISGVRARIKIFETFVEGAKGGFTTAVNIIPYLVAMLVGVAVFRASGALDYIIEALRRLVLLLGADSEWVEALPTMLVKPLSGSGSRALMVDAMQTYGADSLVGRIASIVQGSTDTTLYIVAVYYGAVKVKQTRYTIGYSLLADAAGIIASVFIGYLFFA